ncbi:MAG: efflux transporter periplasmic adaptor subunit [Deltaproteobacteria bacterium RBG_13_52_11b]|nr:MAG: efflux transporter periplasmic adaptor subunit [Deltaproteobacteria bacterium RBG_13_52_11b]
MDPKSDIAKILEIDHSSGRRRGMRRWLFAIIIVLVAVAVAVISKMSGGPTSAQYMTQEVTRGDLTALVTATGTLQPTNEVEVGSELSGIIKRVEVDYNDKVKVGQPLAWLDTSKLDAQVKQSRAALESAKAKVLQAQATVRETQSKLEQLKKVWELSGNKVPSQSDLDAAAAAFERAKADDASANAMVSQAKATLDANETDLSKLVIRSPINGIVLKRNIEPGQTVAAAFTAPVLFTLAEDLTNMELHVNVDEADIGKVMEGQSAEFSVAGYTNRTFKAEITQVHFGSSTTSGVVTYETVLKVDNTDLSLRPGMTATADITVRKVKNTILIPSAALRFSPPVPEEKKGSSTSLMGSLIPRPPSGSNQAPDETSTTKQQRVWILKNGKLTAVPVTIGSTDGIMTEITAGDIEPGMALVIDVLSSNK